MSIKYEIHTLENAGGEGKNRKYVAIHRQTPLTVDQITEHIEHNCSLSKADVLAVLTELRHLAKEQLQTGNRFYILGIGWIALSAGLSREAQQEGHKVTGNDIFPRAVLFRSEEKFFRDICKDVRFTKSKYSTLSMEYTEEEIWEKIANYLQHNDFITCRDMQLAFDLGKYMASKWLAHFVQSGKLRKSGFRHNIVYFAV